MDCNKSDCIHYKVCEEWKSLGNDNYINESNGNCDLYSAIPYNPTGDLISREALKREVNRVFFNDEIEFKQVIDNAPPIGGKDNDK